VEAAVVTRIVTVVGARPQFVKAAVISRLIRSGEYAAALSEYLVHTGQHHDENMSEVFFREMRIPRPDINLGVAGGTHGHMTGGMLVKIERVLLDTKPDLVLVYGDTNSTLAGALAAAKLRLPVAHVEAGLRSYNKKMPEEQNRILTDHLSAYLFSPTERAVRNLATEGIVDRRGNSAPTSDAPLLANVGDVMLDASNFYRKLASERPERERMVNRLGLADRSFRLLTLHREENTDDHNRLRAIFGAINAADDTPTVFPVHPRTRKRLQICGIGLKSHIRAIDPVGYLDMLELEQSCEMVLTDSGGVQKEAFFFSRPCVTLRDQTEWVETVKSGWNTLAGADAGKIAEALSARKAPSSKDNLFGDGDAGRKVLDLILSSTKSCIN
jgi:UDP-GlcNAc3NAcA epimerase